MTREPVSLPLGGLQHFGICRRRWAMIYVERQWADNIHTVLGSVFHENAHNGLTTEKRGEILITRGMEVVSRELALHGVCDVVEFYADPEGIPLFGREGTWRPVPVEYKKGRATSRASDALQLCAQAMCLEEMLCTHIPEAYLYYGEFRRRTEISLDEELRSRVRAMSDEMHGLFERGYTPRVKKSKYCSGCSLADLCLPGLRPSKTVEAYLEDGLREEEP